MPDPMITFRQVSKDYQGTPVLDIPSLALPAGIYWLQGANGAGKTTCMKVMAGLIPFRGEIILQEQVSSRQHPVRYRRLISYAEAEPLFPGFLTGRDLLRLYGSTRGGSNTDMQEVLHRLGIHGYLENPVSSYSSGMLKKLSLALAFSGQPAVILLDEPLITIDSDTVPALYTLIRDYHRQHGVTFCITSHQPIPPGELTVTDILKITDRNISLS